GERAGFSRRHLRAEVRAELGYGKVDGTLADFLSPRQGEEEVDLVAARRDGTEEGEREGFAAVDVAADRVAKSLDHLAALGEGPLGLAADEAHAARGQGGRQLLGSQAQAHDRLAGRHAEVVRGHLERELAGGGGDVGGLLLVLDGELLGLGGEGGGGGDPHAGGSGSGD